jgi:hypothetical protein
MPLGAIERVCMQEKSNTHSFEKDFNKSKKGNQRPGTESMARVPKEVCFKKHCKLCKKHGGMHTMHNTKDCCKYEKDGSEKSGFHTAKNGGKKPNPAKQSFTLLSKILDKLKKAIKKLSAKSKKRCREENNSNSE